MVAAGATSEEQSVGRALTRARSQSLRGRLVLALGLMLVPLVVAGATGVLFLRESTARAQSLAANAVQGSVAVNRVRRLLITAEATAAQAARTGDRASAANFDSQSRDLRRALADLGRFFKPDEAPLARAVRVRWRRAEAEGKRALATLAPSGPQNPLAQFDRLIVATNTGLDRLAAAGYADVIDDAKVARKRERFQLILLLGLLVSGAILAFVVARRYSRSILGPLGRLEDAVRRLAESDLCTRVPVETQDELGRLAETFNSMAEGLVVSRRQLAHQAFHDALTGLANRELFRDRVEHALRRSARQPELVAVLFIDLDDFKNVNDSLGHAHGDELLRRLARRVAGCARPGDTAARLGGDEFAVLVEGAGDFPDVARVATRLLTALGAPVTVEGKQLVIRASVGISASRGEAIRADDMLRNADLAMYAAKEAGGGQYRVYEQGMHASAIARLELEAEIREALEGEQFAIEYQPILRLDTGVVEGVEALVRWDHPTRGRISPAEFVASAEANGLIGRLGRWVLTRACSEVAQLKRRHPDHEGLTLGVNLSPVQFQQVGLVQDVKSALAASGLDARSLVLEITENVLMQNEGGALERLAALKTLGVGLALDDFGTGYSSLSYLREFPIDTIKIDKGFVEELGVEGSDRADVTRAIVHLGRTLGLRMVGEGIEQRHQMVELLRLGCQLGQGYLFAESLPLDALDSLLSRQRSAQLAA